MIRIGGKIVGGVRIAGKVAGGLRIAGNSLPFVSGSRYDISRTLDRTWGPDAINGTVGSGGGNVQPDRFIHEGQNWELWQVVPFINRNVGSNVGDCRIHLRNRDINRGDMELEDMPDQVVLTMANWKDSPWTFNRPTSSSKFNNVGSGNSARKGIDYEPVRSIGANPAAEGIAQGQDFTATLIWES